MTDPGGLRRKVERLLARQRDLVRELLAQRELVQGSVFARTLTCGKPACGCATGKGHGPYHVLSTRGEEGRASVYLTAGQARQARQLVAAARTYRQGLKQLKAVNAALLDLLRRYQRTAARSGSRRLGVTAA